MKRVKTDALIAKMKAAGPYCETLVASCLREASAVKGKPMKDIDLCLRDSETYAAAIAGTPIWTRFSKSRAIHATARWTENFNQQIPSLPWTVLVDRQSGIFFDQFYKTYGFLADIESCLTFDEEESASRAPARNKKPAYQEDRDSAVEDDLQSCAASYANAPETERQAIIAARRGQGRFRQELKILWAERCSVTKSRALSLLRASHIKPWRDSTNSERLDRYNGLLLLPNLDAAFDRGLISFADDGRILLSPELRDDDAKLLGIKPGLKLVCLFAENKPFLAQHRKLHGFPD